MKRILSIFLSLVLTAALLCPAAAAANETDGKDSDWLYITLDPGHGGNGAGGNDPGAISSTYGYHEADLVLKIGLYLKQELETYRNVHVDMTRSDSYGTSATAPLSKVENRVLFAAGQHSDLLVSLHLNSSPSQSARGAEVLVSNGNYRPEIADVLDGIGRDILMQLKNLGIYNRGLVKRARRRGSKALNLEIAMIFCGFNLHKFHLKKPAIKKRHKFKIFSTFLTRQKRSFCAAVFAVPFFQD